MTNAMQDRVGGVAVAMLGARMHYAVPRLLHEAGLLDHFFTDSFIGNKPWLERLLRSIPSGVAPRGVARLLGRTCAEIPRDRVTSFDLLGYWYALAQSRAAHRTELDKVFQTMAVRFAQAVVNQGFGQARALWGFNTASLELFAAARERGIGCVLEQTILPKVLEDELIRREGIDWPGWQPSLRLPAGESLLAQREREEWVLADRIVCGSDFVADGLRACGVASEKISVIPYGVDTGMFTPNAEPARVLNGPLRVLCVGEVGLRKGTPYLLEALASLGSNLVKARFAGPVALAPERLTRFRDVAEFLGPVPRSKMPELFRWAQVFVLPSIVEGSATASYEAVLSGLPVIVTPNTGSIIEDGREGQIVSIRDSRAIAAAMNAYIENPELLVAHRQEALALREKAGLARYGRDLASLLRLDVAR